MRSTAGTRDRSQARRRRRARLLSLGGSVLLLAAATAGSQALADSSFGEAEAPQAAHLSSSGGIAVDQASGDVYVGATSGLARVAKFDSGGSSLFAFGWGVADAASEEQVCTTTCKPEYEIPWTPDSVKGAALASTSGIAVDPAGEHDVYVADDLYSRIEKFKPNGEFLLSFGGDVVASGPDNSSNDEVQTVTVAATGGTYKLSFPYPLASAYRANEPSPSETGPISATASAAELESALDSLATVNGASVGTGKAAVTQNRPRRIRSPLQRKPRR